MSSMFEDARHQGYSGADLLDDYLSEDIFVVANEDGIPYRSQEPMSYFDCKAWIERDIKDLRDNCGLTATEDDYAIYDTTSWRTVKYET